MSLLYNLCHSLNPLLEKISSMKNEKFYLVIPAGGKGHRMKSEIPKQHIKLENTLTIIEQCIKTFLEVDKISGYVVAISDDDMLFKSSDYFKHSKLISVVKGGKERINSVLNALSALDEIAKPNDWILVHDSVRPCINRIDIEKLIKETSSHTIGGILAASIVDTIKDIGENGKISTVDRKNLYSAQTPQMFRFKILKEALNNAINYCNTATDESQAIENLDHSFKIVVGSSRNIKITNSDDIKLANYYLQ